MLAMLAAAIDAEAHRSIQENAGVRVLQKPYVLVCRKRSTREKSAAAVPL